uniref:Uncharacterized protein n=1 Tax=Aegilops tauschii subsp. strangulata TaxID=200361 RepID=A0A452Z9X5_AEGTS
VLREYSSAATSGILRTNPHCSNTKRLPASGGSPASGENEARQRPWLARRGSTSSPTTPSRPSDGPSPCSASCPASPLRSPSAPRTPPPATSYAFCKPARFLKRSMPPSDWYPPRRFLLSCNGEGGLTSFSPFSGKSLRGSGQSICVHNVYGLEHI